MNFKKGDKTIYIPVWAVITGGIVAENIARSICKTIESVTKTKVTKK